VGTVLLISGNCRHFRENQSYLCGCCHGNQVLRASTNARKKRPFQTLNERLSLAKFASPIIDETADRQNLTSFTPVQWFRVKKNHRTSYFGYYGTMQKGVFCIHTRKIGIKRRFTRTPKCTEFYESFSKSQECHFTSFDRFKWHHCLANLPNEPMFYHIKKWISGNLKSFTRNHTLLFSYSCLLDTFWWYIIKLTVKMHIVRMCRTPVQNARFPVTRSIRLRHIINFWQFSMAKSR